MPRPPGARSNPWSSGSAPRPGSRQQRCGLPPGVQRDTFHCVACGHKAHADTAGAINVLRAGLARRDADPA
ncbi:zinc ribbon domain-containing protein [Kitasatospora sp. NPDC001660]